MTEISKLAFAPRKLAAGVAALMAITLPLASCAEPDVAEPAVETVVAADGDWIMVDGVIVSTSPEAFLLDYGMGQITVEVDDWGFYQKGAAFSSGDRVVVSGRVDENLFAADTIEASSVYVENIDTTFYASATDEEAFSAATAASIDTGPDVQYTGQVTGTSQDSFTLGSGTMALTVDVSQLEANPLESGRIETGDRVSIWGDFDFGPEGVSRVVADNVIELSLDTGGAAADTSESQQPGG